MLFTTICDGQSMNSWRPNNLHALVCLPAAFSPSPRLPVSTPSCPQPLSPAFCLTVCGVKTAQREESTTLLIAFHHIIVMVFGTFRCSLMMQIIIIHCNQKERTESEKRLLNSEVSLAPVWWKFAATTNRFCIKKLLWECGRMNGRMVEELDQWGVKGPDCLL